METSDPECKLSDALLSTEVQGSEDKSSQKETRSKSSTLLQVTNYKSWAIDRSARGDNSDTPRFPGGVVCNNLATDGSVESSTSSGCVLEEKPLKRPGNVSNFTSKHLANDDVEVKIPCKKLKHSLGETEVCYSQCAENCKLWSDKPKVDPQNVCDCEKSHPAAQVNKWMGHKSDTICKSEQLVDPSQVSQECSLYLQNLRDSLTKLVQGKQYILDIDLDFFSTLNPFKTMLTDFQYRTLRKIYQFKPPSSNDKQVHLSSSK